MTDRFVKISGQRRGPLTAREWGNLKKEVSRWIDTMDAHEEGVDLRLNKDGSLFLRRGLVGYTRRLS